MTASPSDPDDDAAVQPCPHCEGTGYVKAYSLQHDLDPALPYCKRCNGEGQLIVREVGV